jgi:arsenite-transporting ATPase
VRVVPQFDREMIGLERLAEIAKALFGNDDPTTFFYRGRPYQVRAEDGGHVLEVALPFTSRDGVQLSRDGDELLLQVDGLRRTIVLPRALVDAPTTGAKMDDGILRIRFGTRADVAPEKAARGVKVVAGGTRR